MRNLFPTAEQEATALGDELPGPEHLLLSALLMPEDPTARELLGEVGVTADGLRHAIGRVHAAALETVGLSTDAGLASPPNGPARQLAAVPLIGSSRCRLPAGRCPHQGQVAGLTVRGAHPARRGRTGARDGSTRTR